jgi:ketosteroid isomerase-like protein
VAQGPQLAAAAVVPVAQAYTAAWNAHDLDAVLALFAPDAVVRERRGAVPPEVWDTHDPQVVRAYLDEIRLTATYDRDAFTWVAGHQAIASWAAALFHRGHRLAVGPYREDGATVGWSYREFVDPFQGLPGVGPLAGDAEVVVRDGRIAVLSLVPSPASVQRRRGEMYALLDQAAARQAVPLGDAPRVQPPSPRGTTEPTGVAWPLALSGLALLAGVTAALRRQRLP